MLGKAIAFASKIHELQKDSCGKPYILHPIRIMMKLAYTDDQELMSIAILHDVVEDCDEVSLQTLRDMGFSERVVTGVADLTRWASQTYEDHIERVSINPDARMIKLQDLKDNSDITRLKGLSKRDFDRMKKYQRAYVYLKEKQ
tara:strand:- start:172 stop:603 length:432 start_codon:yes stop_codon:yes gene_type:complete